MEKDVAEGLFLETAQVHNNMYGTSKKAVQDTLASGKVAILDVGECWHGATVALLALESCTANHSCRYPASCTGCVHQLQQ